MQVAMLVPAIRKSVPCNLRRTIACVTYSRNKTRTKIPRYCNESNLLSTSLPNFASCRIYSTESEISLPMLVDGAREHISFLTPLKLLYLGIFRITPYIDKEFDVVEFLEGAKYATTVISKALTNKSYESLQGLVAENMIEILRAKIETLNPNQRQLIAVNEDDMLFYILSDITATIGEEHSIEITTICHYIQGLAEQRNKIMSGAIDFFSKKHLVCNYTFTRKYVNNIGGPWIATFVNHYTVSEV